MSRQDSEFEPTHVLVVTDEGDTDSEVAATNAAIDAVLEHADTVEVWLDEEQLASDRPKLTATLREAFNRIEDGHIRGRVDAVRFALSELLSDTSFHRFVSLERLEAGRDDQTILSYVPDHRTFEVDTDTATGLTSDIRGAIETEAAALLPAGPIVDWYSEGKHYELSPPYLCIDGEGCHRLTKIDSIELDDEERAITIEWSSRSGSVVSTVLSKLGPGRPTTFRFESHNRFEDVATAFRDLAAALDLPVRD